MNLKHFAQIRLQAQNQVSGKDEKKRLLEEVLSQGGKDRKKSTFQGEYVKKECCP